METPGRVVDVSDRPFLAYGDEKAIAEASGVDREAILEARRAAEAQGAPMPEATRSALVPFEAAGRVHIVHAQRFHVPDWLRELVDDIPAEAYRLETTGRVGNRVRAWSGDEQRAWRHLRAAIEADDRIHGPRGEG